MFHFFDLNFPFFFLSLLDFVPLYRWLCLVFFVKAPHFYPLVRFAFVLLIVYYVQISYWLYLVRL